MPSDDIRVRIDGETWRPTNGGTAEYDAIHAAAGAVLAGADEVQILNYDDEGPGSVRGDHDA